MHINQAGELLRAGGWGYLLGDEGAGYWIGREAMRHIALQLELKASDPFTELICKKLRISNWGDIRSIVYGAERSSVAAITKDVATLVLQGDIVAVGILDKASEHLSELIWRSDEIVGQAGLPIIFSGGIASEIPMIFDRLKVHFGERISMGDIDIAVAASLLAQ